MRTTLTRLTCAAAAVTSLALSVVPASAACTRLAFSVNDYGKEGPTNDAKRLLDKYIAKTMAERGITKYTTGKKDVTCELFIDVLLFDEHTCKAEATVCWGDSMPQGGVEKTAGGDEAEAAPKAAAKKPAKSKANIETGSTEKAPAADAAPAKADAAAPAEEEAPDEAPAAKEAEPEGAQ